MLTLRLFGRRTSEDDSKCPNFQFLYIILTDICIIVILVCQFANIAVNITVHYINKFTFPQFPVQALMIDVVFGFDRRSASLLPFEQVLL